MKVEILGPWGPAPAAGEEGACSSYVVSGGGATVLLDCGPGTVSLLQERDLTRRLDAVVILHMDPGHMLDLVPFSTLGALNGLYQGTTEWERPRLYVPREGGLETLSALNAVWFRNGKMPGTVGDGSDGVDPYLKRFAEVFELEEYGEDDRVEVKGMSLTFQRTRHPVPCFAPRLTDGGVSVVYSSDSGYAPELAAHAAGADLFLCEATFLETHPYWTEEHGHMTGELAGRLAAEAEVGRLVLTHLSPDARQNEANLRRARGEFGGTVDLASARSVFHL